MRVVSLSLLLGLAFAGCSEKLTAQGGDDAGASDAGSLPDGAGIPSSSGNFSHSINDHGVVVTRVDATSTTEWHYLDFETGLSVTDGVPDERTWDIALQRFKIVSNGGVSGPGGAFVMQVRETDFGALTAVPAGGEWIEDRPDGELDRDTTADSAFAFSDGADDWYSYDLATHRVSPRDDIFYVVRTPEGNFFKIRMTGYYDGSGTPGLITFEWKRIDASSVSLPDGGLEFDGSVAPDASTPDMGADMGVTVPEGAIEIDAASRTEWTYFRVSDLSVVTPIDPATSTDWDLAFQRTIVRTNGGTSGAGMGGALALEGTTYDAVTTAPETGYEADTVATSEMPGSVPTSTNAVLSAWFNYDFATHTVTPKPNVYIVRTAGGEFAKLAFWQWSEGVFSVSISTIDTAE